MKNDVLQKKTNHKTNFKKNEKKKKKKVNFKCLRQKKTLNGIKTENTKRLKFKRKLMENTMIS